MTVYFFDVSLSERSALYALAKCHSCSGLLQMVIDSRLPSVTLETLYTQSLMYSNSDIKEFNMHMCINHITNDCLHEKHMK